MRAIVTREPGGPETLDWREVPDPRPGPGEVLVRITASAVNRADVLQRQGLYPPPPGASATLGLECSGTITELGDGVDGWQVGDEVCALLSGGGYAEQVVVPAPQLLPVPDGIGLIRAEVHATSIPPPHRPPRRLDDRLWTTRLSVDNSPGPAPAHPLRTPHTR